MTPTQTAAARVSGTIKALEWRKDGSRWIAGLCVILDEQEGYEVDFGGANVAFVGRNSSRDPLGEAKRRAEEWHQAYCLAAIQPDPEPVVLSLSLLNSLTEEERRGNRDAAFAERGWATPSSAGTVSVEAAIKAGAGMVVKRRDHDYRVGNQGFNRFEDALEYAALRALAGERGR